MERNIIDDLNRLVDPLEILNDYSIIADTNEYDVNSSDLLFDMSNIRFIDRLLFLPRVIFTGKALCSKKQTGTKEEVFPWYHLTSHIKKFLNLLRSLFKSDKK